MRLRKILSYVLIFLIFLIPIAVYFIHFCGYSISDNPSDWGVFGDYIGGIYNVLVAILIFILSYRLEKDNKRRAKLMNAAEEITKQIGKIKGSGNKIKSTEKLITLVISKKLLFDSSLYEQLTELTDNYQRANKKEEDINDALEKKVLRNLKRLTE